MKSQYSLGYRDEEQQRLYLQREIYGDTLDFSCENTDTIYEFGCGVGANLWLAQSVPNGQYVGIDNDQRQLTLAKQLAKTIKVKNVSFVYKDAANTGLLTDSADVSFCRLVLIHQSDPMNILNEMCRVTRSGGHLLVIEPFDFSYYLGPNKDNLLKCFKARVDWAYGEGRGSPNVAVNLHGYFHCLPLLEYTLTPHVIFVQGTQKNRCRQFLDNWLGLIKPIIPELLSHKKVSGAEWLLAQQEATEIEDTLFITQTLWIAKAKVL